MRESKSVLTQRNLHVPESQLTNSSGAYHLARKSGNLGLKSNGKVIFRKFCSEIVAYLQRYSSFSVGNGTAGNFLTVR